jgi:hypothetical protein
VTDTVKRSPLRLPFAFGDRVYHRARQDRVAGLVTGFIVRPNETTITVTWGDSLNECVHFFFELTTEFSPFTEES